MNRNKKAARCGDTQTTQQNIYELNFPQLIVTLKAVCFRVAAWVNIVGGGLL
jgi:hypothetical protein